LATGHKPYALRRADAPPSLYLFVYSTIPLSTY
jgi:hypothetical protein